MVFITKAESVYCAVRTGSLNRTDTVSYLKAENKELVTCVGGKQPTFLQHGNASAATFAAKESIGFEDAPHPPPYSPDLAPSDFGLFGALKKHLKGISFTCD